MAAKKRSKALSSALASAEAQRVAARARERAAEDRQSEPVKKQPVVVPAGYYDPALDAALSASQRGYGDLQSDYARDFGADGAGGRYFNDYQIGLGALGQSRDRSLQDLTTGRDRSLQDLTTSRDQQLQDLGFQRTDVNTASTRETQDWQTALTNLNRQFQQLAGVQSANASRGGGSGGAFAQAAKKRAANKAVAQQPLDTSHQRSQEDTQTQLGRIGVGEGRVNSAYDTQTGRVNQDYTTGTTRVGQDYDTQTGQLGLTYQRAGEDASTNLQRAGREASQFGTDTQQSRLYQASQLGYVPPKQPKAYKPVTYKPKRSGTARNVGGNRSQGSGRIY